jgi:hypothetical protein
MGIFGNAVFDTSLRLVGKFCPHPKFAKKEGDEKI